MRKHPRRDARAALPGALTIGCGAIGRPRRDARGALAAALTIGCVAIGRPRCAVLAGAGAALTLGCGAIGIGCGPPPPQAPAPTANRVAAALSGIASACGEHEQLRALPAFGPAPRAEAAVLAAARMRAAELARAVSADPAWIYQGKKLGEVLGLAGQRLRECGLGEAAQALRH